MDDSQFSLDDFKNWMKSQGEYVSKMNKRNAVIGVMVESKVVPNKLINKMFPEDGNIFELTKDFKRSGGKIIDVDGKNFLIEVDSGTFYIAKQFIRKM